MNTETTTAAAEMADTSDLTARAELALGLRQLADYIDRKDVPTPCSGVQIGRHITNLAEYDATVAHLGLVADLVADGDPYSQYETASVTFAGGTKYHIQTKSRLGTLVERAQRIAARERELGIAA